MWNVFKRLAQPLSDSERTAVCAGTVRRLRHL